MENDQLPGSSGWNSHLDAHQRETTESEAGAAAPLYPDTFSPRPEKDLNSSSDPGSNSSMTTKELQEYWRNEKCHCKPVKLLFEIASTRIAKKFSSKYVMYKIIVIQTGSFDSNKAVLERRYSDFEVFHKNLLKNFSEEIEDIIFPKKYLTGNFTEEMISERKLAFKEYLSLLYSIKCVRRSREFIDFLTRAELKEAYGCLRAGQYVKALDIFMQVVPLLEKLTRHCPTLVIPSLCAMLVCHRDLERPAEALEVGEKALLHLQARSSHKYYVPLLEAMIHLAYVLGKDFVSLQERLEKNQLQKVPTRGVTLKELAVREYLH
ncbi:sorting nexin-20 [Petaurus breviceps papuanus]|uniref:sorting nexin-20 n=1 Tax=Petaurus breviceps papuanus TaxID=3040969 RepID=UPI0036DA78C5